MKKFFLVFTLFAVLFSTSFDVDARKKFGSKSTGKTQQTSQQKQQADQPNNAAPAPAATAAKSSSKKGIMGGILGGLLVGGLIATMLGGDFEGLQIMDMLLMALLAFVIFKVVKMVMAKNRQSQPMPAGGPSINPAEQTQQYRENTTGGFATSQEHVPFNLPSGFDTTSFLQGAREHYHTLQKAWNNNDLSTIEEYVSPAFFNELKAERADVTDVATEVLFLDTELARADSSPILWEVSVRFKGKYRDLGDTQEEMINEVWHLERDMRQSNAPWLIVGIEDQAA